MEIKKKKKKEGTGSSGNPVGFLLEQNLDETCRIQKSDVTDVRKTSAEEEFFHTFHTFFFAGTSDLFIIGLQYLLLPHCQEIFEGQVKTKSNFFILVFAMYFFFLLKPSQPQNVKYTPCMVSKSAFYTNLKLWVFFCFFYLFIKKAGIIL